MGTAAGLVVIGRHRGLQLITWCTGSKATDPENLILLCHRHHWMVDEGKWQLVRGDDGRMLTIPPTVTFGQWARGPD